MNFVKKKLVFRLTGGYNAQMGQFLAILKGFAILKTYVAGHINVLRSLVKQ